MRINITTPAGASIRIDALDHSQEALDLLFVLGGFNTSPFKPHSILIDLRHHEWLMLANEGHWMLTGPIKASDAVARIFKTHIEVAHSRVLANLQQLYA